MRAVVDLGEDSEPLTGRCKAYAAPLLTPTDDTKSFYVTILDLRSLLSTPSTSMPQPAVVAEFMVSKRHSVSALRFSSDGGSLMIVPEDGQTIKVFQIRPPPPALQGLRDTDGALHSRRGSTEVSHALNGRTRY